MLSGIVILAIATTVVGTAMSLSYFIQAAKIMKTKSVEDLSIIMFSVFAVGVTLWLIYGILISNMPIIIANAVGVLGNYLVLGLILRYRKR